jgi:hypothetical protein
MMGMTVTIRPESEFLRVSATGEFTVEDASRTFLEVLDAVGRHRREKVLFDGQALVGEPTIIQRFYYGEFAADAVAGYARQSESRAPQFAYVLSVPVLDPQRFGETVAVNRGMHVKAFDNLEDALAWLEGRPA